MAVLDVKNLKKIYRPRFGGNQVQALSCVNFSVEEGEYVAIMGESGSGKTTLLNIMAGFGETPGGKKGNFILLRLCINRRKEQSFLTANRCLL